MVVSHTHTHRRTGTHTHTHTHARTHARTHTHARAHARTDTHTHTHAHTRSISLLIQSPRQSTSWTKTKITEWPSPHLY